MAAQIVQFPSVLLLTTLVTVSVVSANVEYLYYTAPGGAEYGELPGLYGAAADWRKDGAALDYPDSGYQCMTRKDDLLEGLPLRSVSMDPKSRKVLVNLYEEYENGDEKVSLLTADLCKGQDTCENATVTPEWKFNNALFDDKLGPFAYYNNEVYFIVNREQDLKNTIELRKFTGCKDKYPVDDWTSFYLSDCSTQIAVVVEINFKVVSPLKVGDTLYIINSGSEMYFLTQIQRGIYNEKLIATGFQMELYLVKASTKEVSILHTEQVDVKFLRYTTFHVGAIALRNGKLCWSAMDIILCADWSAGEINNMKTVLGRGEAKQACLNPAGRPLTAEITTGIAIANTDQEMAIFFGCIAQQSGYGGAGLVRMKGDKRSVFSLQVNNTDILAGNMFLVGQCKPEKLIPEGEEGWTDEVSATTPVAVQSRFCQLVLVALLMVILL